MTLFFGLITGIMIFEYFEEYDLTSAKKDSAMITSKVSEKSLFTPPSYFVRVELTDGNESSHLHRISKREIQKLEVGETLQGFSIYGDFSTIRDFLYDSLFFVGFIFLFGLFTLLGLFTLVIEIPAVDRFVSSTFLGRPAKGKGMKILYFVMIVFTYFSGRFLLNIVRKVMPFTKTNTQAIITDQTADVSYRVNQDSNYELTLAFENSDGKEIEVIKEVTKNTYDQFFTGNKIDIAYRKLNNYDVFIKNTTSEDIAQAFIYNEIFIYIGMMAVVLFTIYVLFKKRKNERSRAQSPPYST